MKLGSLTHSSPLVHGPEAGDPWARASLLVSLLGTQNVVGPVDIGAEMGAEYLAVAFGAEFLPGTKHVPGELVYPLAAFSPGNLHHSQLLQVRVEVVLLV